MSKQKRIITTARVLGIFLGLALLGPQHISPAQAAEGASAPRSSVLPTGGGQALLDTSDTVILLLDRALSPERV